MRAVTEEVPASVRRTMESISIARIYNNATGATITHRDVDNFGFVEFARIESALNMIGEL